MVNFFVEGGALMFPVLVLGIILVASAARYMIDGEPVRLRFVGVVSLSLLAAVMLAVILNTSQVLAYLSHGGGKPFPADAWKLLLFTGLMESLRPAILGFGLLGLGLDLLAIGVYRVGRRELRAARG